VKAKCAKSTCHHVHPEAERISRFDEKESKKFGLKISTTHCPKCGCKTFYLLEEKEGAS
jgi:hypothetical protein